MYELIFPFRGYIVTLIVSGPNFSVTRFYRLLLMNGINWTLIRNSDSYAIFLKKLLAFIRPVGNSIYGIYDPFGVRLTLSCIML